ncbi:MAG: AlpA family phage regulatory protein [Hyphomicrobium sp.]
MSLDLTTTDPLAGVRVLTMRQLREVIPYTPQHIYRLEAAGKFPSRIRIGENRVVWLQAEIIQWLSERPRVTPRDADF